LQAVGIPFNVVVPGSDEIHFKDPVRSVKYNARLKAESVGDKFPGQFILGVDTVVYIRGRVLGKPADLAEAEQFLGLLNGREHVVFSGICLIKDGISWEGCEKTYVRFDTLTHEEISHYVETCKPLDKAGAYGIQEFSSMFIKGIRGDYFNVVGLPLNLLFRLLKIAGYRFF
jgi:septum formation protein